MKYFLGLVLILFLGIQDIRTGKLTVSLQCDSSTHRGGHIMFNAKVNEKYTKYSLCKPYEYRDSKKFYEIGTGHTVTCTPSFKYKFRDKAANHPHNHSDPDFVEHRTERSITFYYPKKDYEAANYTAEVEVIMKIKYTVTYWVIVTKRDWNTFMKKEYTYTVFQKREDRYYQEFDLKPKPAVSTFLLTENCWSVKWDRSLPFINPPIFITIFLSIFFGLHIMVHL